MNPNELPLLDLFNRLRDSGLPLGIEEYIAALQALQAGFGVKDRWALAQLCCTLWIKSKEETRLFHRIFDQILAQPFPPRRFESSSPEAPTPPSDTGDSTSSLPETGLDPSRSISAPTPASQPTTFPMEMDETAQVVQAIRRGGRGNWPTGLTRYRLLTNYLPVTRRQMKQSWRYLRRPVREGPPEELDIRATIEKVGREGVLLRPVLVPRRSNRAELILLIDQDGSMVPFHALSNQLVETVQRGGRLRQAGVYYFHDYPNDYLYHDPARLEAQPISEMLSSVRERTVVLIVSDAGAARGNFDTDRVERTQLFIGQLQQTIRRCAWLNPMPHHRWTNTTAGEIARLVPMFEMSRHGLEAAIRVLQGRYVYWEKMYPWIM